MKKDYNSNDKLKVDFKGGSPLALENHEVGKHMSALKSIPTSKTNKKQLVFEGKDKESSLLDESNIK